MTTQWYEHVEEGALFLPHRGKDRIAYLVGGLNVSLPDALSRFNGRVCEMRIYQDETWLWTGIGELDVNAEDPHYGCTDIRVGGANAVAMMTNIRAGTRVRVEMTVAPDTEERHPVSEWLSRRDIRVGIDRGAILAAAPEGIRGYLTRDEFAQHVKQCARAMGIGADEHVRRAKPIPEWMAALFALLNESEMHGADYGEDFEIRFRSLSEDESMALSDRADAMARELGYGGWRDAHQASEGGDD